LRGGGRSAGSRRSDDPAAAKLRDLVLPSLVPPYTGAGLAHAACLSAGASIH